MTEVRTVPVIGDFWEAEVTTSAPEQAILFSNKFIYYFIIYFWLCWVFVAACSLSLVAASGGYSLLRCTGSRHVGFRSCGSRA